MIVEPASSTQPLPLFSDAPQNARAPESARALFGQRLKRLRSEHATWIWLFVIASIGAPAALAVASSSGALLAVGVSAVVAVAFLLWQWHKAKKEFWSSYAAARGFQLDDSAAHLSSAVPLLHRGDERKFDRVMAGRLAGEHVSLACFTYTDVTHTTDSEGRSHRQETDHDYTVLALRLPVQVATRFRGVYCRNKEFHFGALQDKLGHDRSITLESVDFHKRYSLRVVDEQDDIALYELFSTTFIDELAGDCHVCWEQVGADLVVYLDGHCTDTAQLDLLCERAVRVLRRYSEEYQ